MVHSKDKLRTRFLEEYEKLNEQQKNAVNTIEGPVMVIAGPGTGKTQILASRIGKILLDTDTSPENILCLTYTDAGVVAMRKRLLHFIGPDAYKVHIYTFHAFCNDVIQDNLSYFRKHELDPVSDLEKVQFFKELIDGLPKNHPLKRYRGDVYFEIKNLDSLFSTMKKEGWTPEWIHRKIEDYINDLPNRDEYIYKRKYREFNVGDLKKDKIEEEIEKMSKLRAAVDLFQPFQAIMAKKNRYDFDDMISWVIRAFEENPTLLANYQEKFQYILVDEYQDTSGTQNRLISLLINFWDKPNVFVVGDDDQSIFRFQGANVENMLDFAESYKNDLITVVLTDNYRSIQPILNVSKTLIDRNEERLVKKLEGLKKDLVSSNPKIKDLTHEPAIHEYQVQREEMIGIVHTVEQLIRCGEKPGHIAVLYKENRYGEELSQYFSLLNIPVYSKRSLNVLTEPLAVKINLLLRYLMAEHDNSFGGDEMLFEILHFSWFGIPAIDIAELTHEVAEKRYSDAKTTLRQLIIRKSKEPARDLFSKEIHANLKQTSAILEELISAVPNVTLQGLFELVIRKTGMLKSIMNAEDKHWQLQVLTALFDFIKDETRRSPSMTLEELVNLIDLMEHENIPLPLVQVNGNEEGVNLLTAHGSKGLEFRYVFFAGCNAGFWEKKRRPSGGYSFPDTIFSSLPAHNPDEELRRLFYVALTRAEQHLFISYSRFKPDGKEQEASKFIAEIIDQHEYLQPVKRKISDEDLSLFSILEFNPAPPEIRKIEEATVKRMLANFAMNVTALNNYLKCPLEFYFKNLIKIPSPKNEATEFGSAVHYALENLFKRMKEDKYQMFPSREAFIRDFEIYMNRHRESFTKEQFSRRMEYGQDVLGNYYDKYTGSLNKVVVTEITIRNVSLDQVPLKGKIDKLEFEGKFVNVVDYKTGNPDNALDKLKGPSDKEPNGGDYWRQAVFYKILLDNYTVKDWKVVSTEFDFIEPDKKKNYIRKKIPIGPEDITTVSQQIRETWEKIQNHEFYTGCGKEDCHWCNFVKTNELTVEVANAVEEEE